MWGRTPPTTTPLPTNEQLHNRLVYLSISPDLYPSVAKAVAEHLRPSAEGGAWLRVVFEKPFGRVRPHAGVWGVVDWIGWVGLGWLVGRLGRFGMPFFIFTTYAHTHTRKQTNDQDLASAERLAAELQEYLKEEEIYRVDHYMVGLGCVCLFWLGKLVMVLVCV